MQTVRGSWFLLVAMSAVFLGLDYVTGPLILFPITFVLPVSLAAWHLGRWPGVGFGVALTTLQFMLVQIWADTGYSVAHEALNAGIHLVVFVGLALVVARWAAQARRVQVLEGLLPICSYCKKIRRADGKWEPVEAYISGRTAAKFTHGLCEPCGREHFPEAFGPTADEPA